MYIHIIMLRPPRPPQPPQSLQPPFRLASSGSYAQEMKPINAEDNISQAWIMNSGPGGNKMKRIDLKKSIGRPRFFLT